MKQRFVGNPVTLLLSVSSTNYGLTPVIECIPYIFNLAIWASVALNASFVAKCPPK